MPSDNSTPEGGAVPESNESSENNESTESSISNAMPQGAQGMEPLPAPAPLPEHGMRINLRVIIAAAVVIVIAIAGLYVGGILKFPKGQNSTTVSTTISQFSAQNITGCGIINRSGTYSVASDINTSSATGPCLLVKANNVLLVGNGKKVTGNAPLSSSGPYSYGIELSGVSNVTVKSLFLTDFSYNVYLQNVRKSKLQGVDSLNASISGIYLYNTTNSTVINSKISGALGQEGAISLQSGGRNNFINDTDTNNYYGLVVNSTNNTFSRSNFENNKPVDIECSYPAGLKNSNIFSDSLCAVNYYCGFTNCVLVNKPVNFTDNVLGKSISTCGAIVSPGTYTLSNDINLSDYVNTSNPLQGQEICLKISAPNVELNCNGHSITNAGYAIYVDSPGNASVSNCKLSGNAYGIYESNSINDAIYNTSTDNSIYGIYLYKSISGIISNVSAKGNSYGVFLNSTLGLTMSGFNASSNRYGFYFGSGSSDVFNNGILVNNTKADAYCSQSTYNETSDQFQKSLKTQCGVTTCKWASACSIYSVPQLSVYPLTSCSSINAPGNYTLTSNIIAGATCFNIRASNVTFNCAGKIIIGADKGDAFRANGIENVSIENCPISKFLTGVNVSNSTRIRISNVTVSQSNSGIALSNLSYSTLNLSGVSGASLFGIRLSKISNSTIIGSFARQSLLNSTGFIVDNVTGSNLSFNNATSNPGYGFEFINSRNNEIRNNSAFSNNRGDYFCGASISGIYANKNGVNSGLTKNQCDWLVVLPRISQNPGCAGVSASSSLSFFSDELYPYGTTCFDLYASHNFSATGTTINCNGHVIRATDGGEFADLRNVSDVTIENCVLENFTNPIVVSKGSSVSIFNDTFNASSTAISFNSSSSGRINHNIIRNSTYGITLLNSSYGSVENNTVSQSKIGIKVVSGMFTTYSDNNVTDANVGILVNASQNNFQNNIITGVSNSSILCPSNLAINSTNTDLGGNICSMASSCGWIKSQGCK